jgi:hypothetical protein
VGPKLVRRRIADQTPLPDSSVFEVETRTEGHRWNGVPDHGSRGPRASHGADPSGKSRIGQGGFRSPGRSATRSCAFHASALASTGPTKPLRRSLTFGLKTLTNQGHLKQTEWPDLSVVSSGRGLDPVLATSEAFASDSEARDVGGLGILMRLLHLRRNFSE